MGHPNGFEPCPRNRPLRNTSRRLPVGAGLHDPSLHDGSASGSAGLAAPGEGRPGHRTSLDAAGCGAAHVPGHAAPRIWAVPVLTEPVRSEGKPSRITLPSIDRLPFAMIHPRTTPLERDEAPAPRVTAPDLRPRSWRRSAVRWPCPRRPLRLGPGGLHRTRHAPGCRFRGRGPGPSAR